MIANHLYSHGGSPSLASRPHYVLSPASSAGAAHAESLHSTLGKQVTPYPRGPNMTIECCPNVESLSLSYDLGTEAPSSPDCASKHSSKRSFESGNSHAPITPNVKEGGKRRSAEGHETDSHNSSPASSSVQGNGHKSQSNASELMPEASSGPKEYEPILSESEDRFVMYPVRCVPSPEMLVCCVASRLLA